MPRGYFGVVNAAFYGFEPERHGLGFVDFVEQVGYCMTPVRVTEAA